MCEGGEGGHEVCEADRLSDSAAGGDSRGPLHEQGYAVASFEDVGLMAPEDAAGVVSQTLQKGEVGLGRASVVGGEDEDRIVELSRRLQSVEDGADEVVDLHDEVGIGVEPGCTLECRRWGDGGVRSCQGQVEEEGLSGAFGVVYVFDGLLFQGREDGFQVPVADAGAGSAVAVGLSRVEAVGPAYKGALAHEGVGRVVGRVHPEEGVEAAVERTAGEGGLVAEVVGVGLVDGPSAVGGRPVQS